MTEANIDNLDLLPTKLSAPDGLLRSNSSKPLLEYLVAGSMLATDHEGYRHAINVTEDEYKQLEDMGELKLDLLLDVQGKVKLHCTKFKDETYPTIISLASAIRAYADKVGGDMLSSYYGSLVEQITILNKAETKADPTKTQEIKDNINDLCDEAISDAQALADASHKAATELGEFEKQCQDDEQNLGYRNNDIQKALESEGGKIEALNKEIQAARDRWWDTYRKFVIATTAAATSPFWLLIPVFGLVLMPVAAGVGSAEAQALHKTMEECDNLIEKDSKEVANYMKLSFDTSNVQTRTKALYDLIGPAVKVLQQNKATWSAIADDIANIKKEVGKTESRIHSKFLAEKNVKYLLSEWDKIGKLADDFRLNAYTTDDVQRVDKTELEKRLKTIVKGHDM